MILETEKGDRTEGLAWNPYLCVLSARICETMERERASRAEETGAKKETDCRGGQAGLADCSRRICKKQLIFPNNKVIISKEIGSEESYDPKAASESRWMV